MKIIEILLEYNQAITARRFGAQIIKLAHQDERFDDIPDDQLINQVLDIIETRDPTPNKEYTQRLVELYVTGNLNIDRINQNRLLEAHWIGKRRGMIRQEHANFNVFKSYDAFEAVMSNPELYDIEAILTKSDDKGKSTKVYEDNQIRIVVPHDKTASCYYGQATKWCTAATKSENRFYEYQDDNLYMILPKRPRYPKEKYQFYFPNLEFKNDENLDFNLGQMLEYYPGVATYFRTNRAEDVLDMIAFWTESDLKIVCKYIIDKVNEHVNDDRIQRVLSILLKPKPIMNWVKQNYSDTVDFSPRYLFEYNIETMRSLNLITSQETHMLIPLVKKYNEEIVEEIINQYNDGK